MNNPEKPIIDDIDALIATELDADGVPLDDYNVNRYAKCELCHRNWHGLSSVYGCPGAYATDEQVKLWVANNSDGVRSYIGAVTAYYEGELHSVRMYVQDGRFVGLLMPTESDDSDEAANYGGAQYTCDEARATLMVEFTSSEVPQYNPEVGLPTLHDD